MATTTTRRSKRARDESDSEVELEPVNTSTHEKKKKKKKKKTRSLQRDDQQQDVVSNDGTEKPPRKKNRRAKQRLARKEARRRQREAAAAEEEEEEEEEEELDGQVDEEEEEEEVMEVEDDESEQFEGTCSFCRDYDREYFFSGHTSEECHWQKAANTVNLYQQGVEIAKERYGDEMKDLKGQNKNLQTENVKLVSQLTELQTAMEKTIKVYDELIENINKTHKKEVAAIWKQRGEDYDRYEENLAQENCSLLEKHAQEISSLKSDAALELTITTEQLKIAHAREISQLKTNHSVLISQIAKGNTVTLNNLKKDNEKKFSELADIEIRWWEQGHAKDTENYEAEISLLKNKHEHELITLRSGITKELRGKHAAEMAELKKSHDEELTSSTSLLRKRYKDLDGKYEATITALEAEIQKLKNDQRETKLAHEEELEEKLDSVRYKSEQKNVELRKELKAAEKTIKEVLVGGDVTFKKMREEKRLLQKEVIDLGEKVKELEEEAQELAELVKELKEVREMNRVYIGKLEDDLYSMRRLLQKNKVTDQGDQKEGKESAAGSKETNDDVDDLEMAWAFGAMSGVESGSPSGSESELEDIPNLSSGNSSGSESEEEDSEMDIEIDDDMTDEEEDGTNREDSFHGFDERMHLIESESEAVPIDETSEEEDEEGRSVESRRTLRQVLPEWWDFGAGGERSSEETDIEEDGENRQSTVANSNTVGQPPSHNTAAPGAPITPIGSPAPSHGGLRAITWGPIGSAAATNNANSTAEQQGSSNPNVPKLVGEKGHEEEEEEESTTMDLEDEEQDENEADERESRPVRRSVPY